MKAKLWCNNCKSNTHSDKACRKHTYSRYNKDVANHVHTGDENKNENGNDCHTFVFGLSNDVCSLIQDDKIKPELLLVDCGATAHIVNDDSNFTYVDESYRPEEHYIELADGKRTNNVAKKRGTVTVNIRDEAGELRKGCLYNALYVPSYPQNIFSVRAATEKGANSGELITADGVKFPIQTIGRLYYLNMCKSSSIGLRSCNLQEWHRILGHLNKTDVLRLENDVDDMKITHKEDFQCTTCILSKQTVTRNREADKRATAPLELIHTHLAGPIETVAKDGFRYAIIFVDDFSSAIFVYFLKHKSDSVVALNKFLSDSSPYGKVKRMRSDNGGKYISKEFEYVSIQIQILQRCTHHHFLVIM